MDSTAYERVIMSKYCLASSDIDLTLVLLIVVADLRFAVSFIIEISRIISKGHVVHWGSHLDFFGRLYNPLFSEERLSMVCGSGWGVSIIAGIVWEGVRRPLPLGYHC